MPIRLAQVGTLGYVPAHVELPSDYVGISPPFPDDTGLRPPSGAYPVALKMFECPSCISLYSGR